MGWGHSQHSFDSDIMINGKFVSPKYAQGSIGMRLDDFLNQINFFPNYINK